MNFRIDRLHEVLYKPREAFEDMKPDVGMQDGIIMAVILIAIGSLISYGIMVSVFGSMLSNLSPALASTVSMANLSSTVMNIVIGVITLVISALLAGWIAAAWAKKQFNMDKSIALVGYSSILDMVQTVVLAIVLAVVLPGVITQAGISTLTGQMPAGLASAMGMIGIVGILFFIWGLWIKGTAVAVANETSTAKGIISWFMAAIIIGLIVGLVVTGAGTAGMAMF